MWTLVVIGGLILIVGFFVLSRGRYYGRLFSVDSFREFHGTLSKAFAVAQGKQPNEPASINDGTGFMTSSGLAVGVSCSKESTGTQKLHVSLSQPGNITTHELCSRFGFFVVAMLGDARGEFTPFYTDSGVHHLVFRFQAPVMRLQDFDSSYAQYLSSYKPIAFRHEKMKSEQGAAANSRPT
jgi:hypothetical protein